MIFEKLDKMDILFYLGGKGRERILSRLHAQHRAPHRLTTLTS